MPAHPEAYLSHIASLFCGVKRIAKVEESEMLYNQAIYLKMTQSYSTPGLIQHTVFAFTWLLCLALPFYVAILRHVGVSVFGESNTEGNASWDKKNGIVFPDFDGSMWTLVQVVVSAVEKALKLEFHDGDLVFPIFTKLIGVRYSTEFEVALVIACLIFLVLFMLDVGDFVSWPESWRKKGVQKLVLLDTAVHSITKSVNLITNSSRRVSRQSEIEKSASINTSVSKSRRGRSSTPKIADSDSKIPNSKSTMTKASVAATHEQSSSLPHLSNQNLLVTGESAVSPCESYSTHCYEEMFAEPPRLVVHRESLEAKHKTTYNVRPALCGRPGNVYSNFLYVFAAFLIGLATFDSKRGNVKANLHFGYADFLFAVALLALAILSVMWHGSHYNGVHYYDLLSMDFCIGYCIIRMLCMVPAGMKLLSLSTCGMLCSAVSIIFLVFLYVQRECSHGNLEHSCRFSGRKRLALGELDVFGACLYLAMPVVYFALPIFLQVFVFEDSGSFVLGSAAAATLTLGWSYRFTERFCLDGNWFMSALWGWRMRSLLCCQELAKGSRQENFMLSAFRGVGEFWIAAVAGFFLSPTAVLHWTTGMTLLFAYAHVRSIEDGIVMGQ